MPRRASCPPRPTPLFLLVSGLSAVLAVVLLAGCEVTPSAGSPTPITGVTEVAASARSPLDGARLTGAVVRRSGAGLAITTTWAGRRGEALVVRDGVLLAGSAGAPEAVPPTAGGADPAVVAGLGRYGETPLVVGTADLPDGRVLALVTDWRRADGTDPAELFRGLWLSDRDTLERWTPYAVPGAEGPGLTSLGAGARGLLWVTTADGRLVVSTDGGESFSEQPARPSP